MSERVTPYDDTCTVYERIDEIVRENVTVHLEMMNEQEAWMRVGDRTFWIIADKNKLIIRQEEP